jgi:hypothetical protein
MAESNAWHVASVIVLVGIAVVAGILPAIGFGLIYWIWIA